MATTKMKASQLVAELKKRVGEGYAYGAIGELCTIALLKILQGRWGEAMGNGYFQLNGDYTRGKCGMWLGRKENPRSKYANPVRVQDCSGLIRDIRRDCGFGNVSASAQGVFDQCPISNRGGISKALCPPNTKYIGAMPMIPGAIVTMFSASKKRMSHVGVYIGNGLVIESMGATEGVVITKFVKRKWQAWGLLAWLDYDMPMDGTGAAPDKDADPRPGDNTNPKPDDLPLLKYVPLRHMKGDKVRLMQKLLVAKGEKLPKHGIDGDFGAETLAALKSFQSKHRDLNGRPLVVDGKCGILTWTALLD